MMSFDTECALQVPSNEIDKSTPKFFSHWDQDTKMFTV